LPNKIPTWIRQLGAYLALAAVALQIVLSFGHLHLPPVIDISLSAIAHRITLTQAQPRLPTQNPGDDNDYCAICASIFLASTSLTPVPTALPVPADFQRVECSFDQALYFVELYRLGFQSRAPPAT
jgi:hypothetical protein